MNQSLHPTREEWERYLEGELTQARARELDLHRAICTECRTAHADAEALFRELAHVPPQLLEIDLVPRIEARLTAPRERSRRWVVASLALAAGVAMLVWLPKTDLEGEMRAKGTPLANDAWVGIEAFSSHDEGLRALRNEPIAPGDALAFAYRNIGAKPFEHLMIFAVSGAGEVYWYYPEYADAASNPTSVGIESGTFDLPERVSHRLPRGTLYIYGLFTRTPQAVKQIEAMVASMKARERLPIPDSGQHILRVEVRQ